MRAARYNIIFRVAQSIKCFGRLPACIGFYFSALLHLVSDSFIWFYVPPEINGLIEEPHEEEMASASERLVPLLMEGSVPWGAHP